MQDMSENDSNPVCLYLDDFCAEIKVEEQDDVNIHAPLPDVTVKYIGTLWLVHAGAYEVKEHITYIEYSGDMEK